MTIMEVKINSLGATCIYSIDCWECTRNKRIGYGLLAEAEWDTGKVFLYDKHGARERCTWLDMTVIEFCALPRCTCDFGWICL
ncbi:hypothetical protein RHGRI_009825 [Rhododendron griersonianum]|uniref:Uncharacterized protein n=1 Tax=Rhododendron griersonianum TaxID=479676 RepID=A0AAV6KHF2_9ERIC|nr:hypothetical protein RHGRI_009825 [Rhododendron griersonianum]